jgi:energy-converting hydrogenase Eha subunit C
MNENTMRPMSRAQMTKVEGGGFWDGFACGGGIVTSIAVALSPEPLSKITMWSVWSGTWVACASAIS